VFVGYNLTNYIDEPFLLTLINNVPSNVRNKADLVVVNQNSIRDLKSMQFSKDVVIIGVIDHFRASSFCEYSYWNNNSLSLYTQILTDIATRYPTTKFIVATNQESVSETLLPNISIIRASGQIADSRHSYTSIEPVLTKNADIKKPGVSLNRLMRTHRTALVSMLYGMELDKSVHISALKLSFQVEKGSNDLLEHLDWMFEPYHNHIRNYLLTGFKKVYKLQTTNFDCYKKEANTEVVKKFDNASNFNNNLKDVYTNSLVEIVSETLFSEPDVMVTEKFLNSVYGCNFPILVAPKGTVQHLRDVGFDMFDDVVDHSYDTVDNPIDRMYQAVNGNSKLLTTATLDLWNSNEQRFIDNVEFAKIGMYKFYKNRFNRELQHVLRKSV